MLHKVTKHDPDRSYCPQKNTAHIPQEILFTRQRLKDTVFPSKTSLQELLKKPQPSFCQLMSGYAFVIFGTVFECKQKKFSRTINKNVLPLIN